MEMNPPRQKKPPLDARSLPPWVPPPTSIKLLRETPEQKEWQLGLHVVCRERKNFLSTDEVSIFKLLKEHTSLPFPDILTEWVDSSGPHFVLSERINGECLKEAWPRMSIQEKERIVDQVAGYLGELRNVKANFLGRIDRKPLDTGQLFDSDTPGIEYGPFESDAEFWEEMIKPYANDIEITETALSRLKTYIISAAPYTFTHGFLKMETENWSCFTVRDGNIVGFTSWDDSGFYPVWWEYVKLKLMTPSTEDEREFTGMLLGRIEQHPEAYEILRDWKFLLQRKTHPNIAHRQLGQDVLKKLLKPGYTTGESPSEASIQPSLSRLSSYGSSMEKTKATWIPESSFTIFCGTDPNTFCNIWSLGADILLKEHPPSLTPTNEYALLNYLRQETKIPIPEVLYGWTDTKGITFTLVKLLQISGAQTLATAWPCMLKQQKEQVARQVVGYIGQLRKLRSPFLAHDITGTEGLVEEWLFPHDQFNPHGPFKNDGELWEEMTKHHTDTLTKAALKILKKQMPPAFPCTFTHGNLDNMDNIIVKGGKVIDILGWSRNSGFFPVWWEYVKLCLQGKLKIDDTAEWNEMLTRRMEAYPRALKVMGDIYALGARSIHPDQQMRQGGEDILKELLELHLDLPEPYN